MVQKGGTATSGTEGGAAGGTAGTTDGGTATSGAESTTAGEAADGGATDEDEDDEDDEEDDDDEDEEDDDEKAELDCSKYEGGTPQNRRERICYHFARAAQLNKAIENIQQETQRLNALKLKSGWGKRKPSSS